MGKIRIYQFAKLMKVSNDEAVELLRRNGVEVKSSLSSIDEGLVAQFQSKGTSGLRSEPPARDPVPSARSEGHTVPKPVKAKATKPPARKPAAKAKPVALKDERGIAVPQGKTPTPSATKKPPVHRTSSEAPPPPSPAAKAPLKPA